jgi:hypothetical protein
MENLERFEDLSGTERATLARKRRFAFALPLILVMAITFTYGLVALLSGRWTTMLIAFSFTIALTFFPMRGSIRKWSALNADLHGGKKKVLVNRIESQRQDIRQGGDSDNPRMIYTYLIKVKGRELEVTEAQYYQCKPGQLAEIQLAPNSESVLSLRVLKDSAATT